MIYIYALSLLLYFSHHSSRSVQATLRFSNGTTYYGTHYISNESNCCSISLSFLLILILTSFTTQSYHIGMVRDDLPHGSGVCKFVSGNEYDGEYTYGDCVLNTQSYEGFSKWYFLLRCMFDIKISTCGLPYHNGCLFTIISSCKLMNISGMWNEGKMCGQGTMRVGVFYLAVV